MSVKAHIADPGDGIIAKVSDLLDGTHRLHVDALISSVGQQPIPVTFSSGSSALPKMVTLSYNQTIGAIVANQYKRALTYTVPVGYNAYLIRYSSFQAEATQSRVVAELQMATLNLVTNAITLGSVYTSPQWTCLPQIEITQAVGSAANVTVTITYTNELGVAGRTGTVAIPKSSIIGTRLDVVLQVGDLGIRSIENLSTSPTSSSGDLVVQGFIQLGYHEDGGTVSLETLYSPGATTSPEGTVLCVEHSGGTVSKVRRFDVLIQLLAVI